MCVRACVRACVRVCVDVLHEVWECLMVFWHLVCVSWSRARDLLNGTVCTLFIMQAGPIPTGTQPWSACLLSLAPSPLLSTRSPSPAAGWIGCMQVEQRPECSESVWLALATVAGLHLPGFWLRFGPWMPLLLSFSLSLSFPQCARDLALASPHNLLTPPPPPPQTPGPRPLPWFVCRRSVCY